MRLPSGDHDGASRARNAADQLEDALHLGAAPDQLSEAVAILELGLQTAIL